MQNIRHLPESSGVILAKANKLSSGFVLKYPLFLRDRQIRFAAAAAGFGGDGAMDLLSYVEFQNSYKMVQKGHSNVLK